jgi:phosphatidylserine decarboxylase
MVPTGTNPTVQSHVDDEEDQSDSLSDDGLSSSSSDDEFEDALTEEDNEIHHSPSGVDNLVSTMYDTTIGLPYPKPSDRAQSPDQPKTAGLLAPSIDTPNAKTAKTPNRQSSLPGYFDRPTRQDNGETPGTSAGTPGGKHRRPIFRRDKSRAASKRSTKRDFNFDANQGRETLGIVIMEIKSASDLPKMKNGK